MYRLKIFICLALVLALTSCYQTESTIGINPDGSGVITSTFNFDNATEEQRQQVADRHREKTRSISDRSGKNGA